MDTITTPFVPFPGYFHPYNASPYIIGYPSWSSSPPPPNPNFFNFNTNPAPPSSSTSFTPSTSSSPQPARYSPPKQQATSWAQVVKSTPPLNQESKPSGPLLKLTTTPRLATPPRQETPPSPTEMPMSLTRTVEEKKKESSPRPPKSPAHFYKVRNTENFIHGSWILFEILRETQNFKQNSQTIDKIFIFGDRNRKWNSRILRKV